MAARERIAGWLKRHHSFIESVGASVVGWLISLVITGAVGALLLLSEDARTLAFQPVPIPAVIAVAVPVLLAWIDLRRLGARTLVLLGRGPLPAQPGRVEIGGRVTLGPVAFRVREMRGVPASDQFNADGPYCAVCGVRLGFDGRLRFSPLYFCTNDLCEQCGRELDGLEIERSRNHAERLVEAEYRRFRAKGRQPQVKPDIPIKRTVAAGEMVKSAG